MRFKSNRPVVLSIAVVLFALLPSLGNAQRSSGNPVSARLPSIPDSNPAPVASRPPASSIENPASRIDVHFSPDGGCTAAITNAIFSARTNILVQAYSFTSAPIAQSLVLAHRRGVKVQVILDKSQKSSTYSSATFLQNNGITPLIDTKHAIAHNKVIVIDGRTVITGSFNFTKAAEDRNAENLLIIHDPAIAGRYMTNWMVHAKHAQ